MCAHRVVVHFILHAPMQINSSTYGVWVSRVLKKWFVKKSPWQNFITFSTCTKCSFVTFAALFLNYSYEAAVAK